MPTMLLIRPRSFVRVRSLGSFVGIGHEMLLLELGSSIVQSCSPDVLMHHTEKMIHLHEVTFIVTPVAFLWQKRLLVHAC